MKVILNKDYSSLGEEGDVIDVKRGFARNYLIPQKIAVYDSYAARMYFKSREAAIAKRKEEKRLAGLELKKRLEMMEVKFTLPVADNGRLFGSVTPVMLHDYFAKEGIEIERKKIDVNSKEIRTPGNYSFVVSLYGGESQTVKLVIVAEAKPEKPQASARKPRRERDFEAVRADETSAEVSEGAQETAPEAEN